MPQLLSTLRLSGHHTVMKSALGIDTIDPAYYTPVYGHGHTPPPGATEIDVGRHHRPAAERGASVLRAPESGARRREVRCFRRGAVREVLRRRGRPPESGTGLLLPAAAARLLRRVGLGARDRVAGRRLAEHPPVLGLRPARAAAGPLDAVADAAADRRRDASGRLYLGVAAAGGRAAGGGPHDWDRRHDARSQRGDADDRASGHGRRL